MRAALHKTLIGSLLAAYVGIVLLGQGLHLLLPDCCEHRGLDIVHFGSHCHEPCCAEHELQGIAEVADALRLPTGPVIAANNGTAHSHACEICEFIYQAVTEPPQLATLPAAHALVANLPCQPQGLYSAAVVGLHAARGPPQLFA